MKFTLRQLEIFLAIARHDNLGRAATDLNLSQSAASDALRELEHQFDVQLFDRVGKRLQLNDLGRFLQPRAEELLSRAQALEQALAVHEGVGSLKVGATVTIGSALAIPLISQYRQRYPTSRVTLEVGNTGQISHKVANFELDIGLIEGEVNNPVLEITRWRTDRLVLFASRKHVLAAKEELDTRDLRAANWILRETGSGTRQTFDRVMHDLVPELHIALELQQTEAILQAVKAGLGLGCLSEVLLKDAFASGELVPLHAPERDFTRHLYMILHRNKYKSAAISHWQTLCNESAS
ncbi:MAG: LysR substrate-binding domain-containing protein [Pseudomonadota bacterium]|nr:LysR substrate-binding domain-containing protein [Pseudomonadota bacterium]